jgi:hypothetical protein
MGSPWGHSCRIDGCSAGSCRDAIPLKSCKSGLPWMTMEMRASPSAACHAGGRGFESRRSRLTTPHQQWDCGLPPFLAALHPHRDGVRMESQHP